MSSGRVDLLSNASLDFEEITSYMIRIIASDNGDAPLSRLLYTTPTQDSAI